MNWTDIAHFDSNEFDSPDVPGSGLKMNIDFVAKLDTIREKVGLPLSISSGFRTPEHNAKVGSVDSSAHETGHAADILTLTSTLRFKVLQAAMFLGINRIGVGNTFVHLDDSDHHAQNVVWTYPATRKA